MPENSWTPTAIATMALAATTLMLAIAVALEPLFRFIKLLKSQPASTPSQTKAIRDRRPLIFFWIPLIGLIFDVVLLIIELRSSAAVSRPRIFLISFLAALILVIPLWMVIGLFIFVLTHSYGKLFDSYGKLFDAQRRLHDSIEYRLTRVETISQGILDLLIGADELTSETHAKLGPILTKVKDLTEKRQLDRADYPPTLDT